MAEEKYIMAIDQGTTSSRAIIFDKKETKLVVHKRNLLNIFLMQAGWNIMPMKFGILFNPLLQCSLIESGVKPTDIAGIGITNQRETTVVWDKATGLPIYNAIVWQSRQTTPIADQLKEDGYSEMIHEKLG